MNAKKIAILYICTGKYKIFWDSFFTSCEKYFIPSIQKEYFVFTDAKILAHAREHHNIHCVYQKDLGWPGNTLYRYHMFLGVKDQLEQYDYIFFFNANVLFLLEITEKEFLPFPPQKFVAWQHVLFYNKKKEDFTYDRNPRSSAYIPFDAGEYYLGGGLLGGIGKEFLTAVLELKKDIEKNKKNKIIALWHDESHWNKYLLDKIHITKILTPGYLYSEGLDIPFTPKILLLDKMRHGGLSFKMFLYCKKNIPYLIKNKYEVLKKKLISVIWKQ